MATPAESEAGQQATVRVYSLRYQASSYRRWRAKSASHYFEDRSAFASCESYRLDYSPSDHRLVDWSQTFGLGVAGVHCYSSIFVAVAA